MSVKHYYQRTDEQGHTTGKVSPTKVSSWLVVPALVALWVIYLVHLGHGHEQILSVWEVGGLTIGAGVFMATLYFAERKLGEAGADAMADRFRDD